METISLSQEQLIALLLLATWTIIWKAFALWRAARNNSKVWFGVFMVFNTVGLLEILYIFLLSKNKDEENNKQ